MAAYRLDDQPIKIWTYDQPKPDDLCAAIEDGAIINAWNCQFETLGFDMLASREGWPKPRYDRYVDTAAAAAAMALPRALGDAAAVLGLDVQKDKDGMRLIRKFSIPRRARKNDVKEVACPYCDHGVAGNWLDGNRDCEECSGSGIRFEPYGPDEVLWNEPADHPEDWELFKAYCVRDVETEEAAAQRIVPLSEAEQKLWLLDQEINRRGIRIDRQSATAAIALADKSKRALDAEMRIATGGYVGKCSEPGKLVDWMKAQGVAVESADKPTLEDVLHKPGLPDAVRRAVDLRLEAAKTSVSKLTAMLNRASADGRIRGSFMYHAASTGRWTSVGVNFANLPRPRKEFETAALDPAGLFDAIRVAEPEWLKCLYGEELGRPLHLLSDAIRGFIMAAPGHDLIQADYSGIEGAVAAWLAGETWKVKALHEIAADPSLPDMYRRTAAGIMNMSTDEITKKHPLRQSVGKTSELALGFGGGVSAFFTMAKGYGVDLDGIFEPVWAAADEERREKASKRFERELKAKKSRADQMSREAWIACEIVKHGWRETNPAIAAGWKVCEAAIREAIQTPGRVVPALKCSYLVAQGFLWCRLPSGRCLAYATPRLKDQVWACRLGEDGEWLPSEVLDRDYAEAQALRGLVKIEGETSPKATVCGVDGVTKKWNRFALYGGLAFQNCLSADCEVLTPSGWRQIISIQPTDKVWDGQAWVSHAGVICQGSALTIDFGGLRLTPDHKVWTDDGWKRAGIADPDAAEAASPSPRPNRETVWPLVGRGVRRQRRQKEHLASSMRMRHTETVGRFGAYAGPNPQLWVPAGRAHQDSRHDARHVAAQALSRMGRHARTLREPIAKGLRSLRWAWHSSVRSLVKLSRFPGGHAADVGRGLDVRAVGQRGGLFARQLCVAGPAGAGAKQAEQRACQDAAGRDAAMRSRRGVWHQYDDPVLSDGRRVAGEAYVRSTGSRTQDHELVYDLVNAGPRHRFTVRSKTGRIFIVSNCVQAIARDLLVNGMLKAEAAGYPVIGHVYDEMFCEMPRGTGDLAAFEKLICELPDWARGTGDELDLPLTAGGWVGKRYRKD